jgi:hypothetical protein
MRRDQAGGDPETEDPAKATGEIMARRIEIEAESGIGGVESPRPARPRTAWSVLRLVLFALGGLVVLVGVALLLAPSTLKLEAKVVVAQPIDQVWEFLAEPANLARWDRSVAKVVPTSAGPPDVGYAFDTFAPPRGKETEGQRRSYRVLELQPGRSGRILRTDSRVFQTALWTFRLEPAFPGTRISSQKRALSTDLQYLARALAAADPRRPDQ